MDGDPRPDPPPAERPWHPATGRSDPLRLPPHSFEAEMALLGALLSRNAALDRVVDFLAPHMFADARHGAIYDAVRGEVTAGRVADPITLKAHFEGAGLLADVGGVEYLARLAASVVTVVNAEDYGRTIERTWVAREGILACEEALAGLWASSLDAPPDQVLETLEAAIYKLGADRAGGAGGRAARDWGAVLDAAIAEADAAMRAPDHVVGVATGLRGLDRLTGGLRGSHLIVVGGRPSMGKSGFALHVLAEAAAAGWTCDLFSHEMTGEEHAQRFLAQKAKVNSHAMRTGYVKADEFAGLMQARDRWRGLPISVDDTPALTVSQLRLRARRSGQKFARRIAADAEAVKAGTLDPALAVTRAGPVVVDYMQLMKADQDYRGNRVQEVSEVSRGLKVLAKELDRPVVALAQLSRAVEQRENKRPRLSDLRESGTIEQDADEVIFLYRAYEYLRREDPGEDHPDYTKWVADLEASRNVCEIDLAKHRGGPTGLVRAYFNPELVEFGNLSEGGE